MEAEVKTETEVIKTKYWELPVISLDGWQPYSAYLDYRLFEGPDIGPREKGLSLKKEMLGGANGPKGGGKSVTISYFIAKKMRCGIPAYTNYPISFYVIEADGTFTYYESHPLDLEALCRFSPELRKIVVGVTELQYYVEARTSGRLQNRMTGYQIMQIRKTGNSFFYDVQSQDWVDKRFGWSDDFNIECRDVARMPYYSESIADYPAGMKDEYGNLKEGAVALWNIKDISGMLTGVPYKKGGIVYEDIQFDAWYFWDIFPTHFIIDAWAAYHSLKTADDTKAKDKDDLLKALNSALSEFLEAGDFEVEAHLLWNKASDKLGKKIDPYAAGRILKAADVTKRNDGKGNYFYDLSVFLKPQGEKQE